MKEIKNEIVGVSVNTVQPAARHIVTEVVDEKLKRPDVLEGKVYKLKTPLSESALYITIADVVINQGTDFEKVQPFEIFINSKDMKHFQWVVALTRTVSAVFKKGGDITFIVDELKSVQDPNGGYMGKGGVWIPSLVAEIGRVIERHMKGLGLIKSELTAEAKKIIAEKKEQYIQENGGMENATICPSCSEKAVVNIGGCNMCLNCGHSRCS